MAKKRIPMSILEEVRSNWNTNWKIILLFFGAFITSVNIMWQVVLSYKLAIEIFYTFFSALMFSYLSGAIVLVFKFHQVKLETVIVKQAEANIRLRDLSEAYIQLAGAKPDKVESIIDTIRQVSAWDYSNRQLEYLHNLEKKLDHLLDKKENPK
ncbi:MAG: hypothetical protein ACFFG0_18520 [Candidatus Thorarchaeota archaeon]